MGLSSPQRAQPPIFGPRLLWPNGRMDQDPTWYGGRPRLWPYGVRWEPSSPKLHSPSFRPMSVVSDGVPAPLPQKRGGHSKGTSRNFRPMSIVAKRSPISSTVEHLLHSSPQCVSILCSGPPLPPPQNCPLQWGSGFSVIAWFLGPNQVINPEVISIG